MRMICPNCNTHLNVNESRCQDKLKDPNVWVKCPKCGDRFHPQLFNIEELSQTDTFDLYNSPAHTQIDKIIDEIKHNDISPALLASELLYTQNGSKLSPGLAQIVSGVIICFILVITSLAYFKATPETLAQQPVAKPAPQVYAEKQFTADVLAMRRDILSEKNVARNIAFSGRESRVYKYLINKLAPDHCQDMVSMQLWSQRTVDGVKFKGECLNRANKSAEISLNWSDEKIEALFRPDEDPFVMTIAQND